uniref:Zinc finger PHD-type domain-containing protein n=1 Tax=Fagus sylvatica TaxID=28930 RepID=A0A2N9IEL9_FAGSY
MTGRSQRSKSTDPPDDWVDGSWTVDCVCGVNFDDGEEMVNCDECGVWVHTRCSRYVKGDDIFVCDKCKTKNNRNDSEETEVAQLLVELPTKTMRMENSFASTGPPRRPFRLWTDIPMEERVHVQGIPGGDPALFSGLSSVFTPELWKCTGCVPKKFNFQYREFPCWDEKKEGDSRVEDENENPVDKGAGVLFSLSKERVLATAPVTAFIGVRGRSEEGGFDRKAPLKEMKKWESEDFDARRAQNGAKKERSFLRPVVVQASKRKKEDLGTSKDRSGKKKARVAEKEADARKKGSHSSKTAFTPTSDAKQLEFYEDRGSKFIKDETKSIKNKNLKGTVVPEHVPDGNLTVENNVEELKNNLAAIAHSPEALTSDFPRCASSAGAGLKGEKDGNQVPIAVESSPKTADGAASLLENNVPVKEEGASGANDNFENSTEVSARSDMRPSIEDLGSTAPEVKDNQILQDFNGDMSLSSVQPNVKVKTEEDDANYRGCSNSQSSPLGDAKDTGISSDQMSENSKANDAVVSSSQSRDDKAQDVERNLDAVSDYPADKFDELSGGPCQLKRELEGSESSEAVKKIPSDAKQGLASAEEHSRSVGTILNGPMLTNQRKMMACVGKSSSTSSTIIIPKSSTDDFKPADTQNPNSITKQRVTSDSNLSNKKDRALSDVVKDEERDDLTRNTVKERPKSSENSALKSSHSSRVSHDSVPKRTVSDSKDNSSSKLSSAQNIATTTGSGESAVSLHQQKSVHAQNKTQSSGLPQRGEKFNQTNFQPTSKMNQNHGPSTHPLPSNSPATLSDEELALLLHQELNSSPRVPRVPRMRHAGTLPQLASPSATSMLIKRSSSSGGKDHNLVPRRKYKDASKDGFRSSREHDDEAKKMDRVPSSPDQRRQEIVQTADASTKSEENGSPTAFHSVKKNIPPASTATTNSGPSSSTEANERNLSSIRSSPRNTSDDDTGAVGGPVHRTLPGLINEIMSKGRRMTYEELCNAVLPHWHNLRKHNGERYAYSSHSQAVLDCLRNRHEWARLVDRGPKTNSSRKRRKSDADESEDNEYGKSRTAKEVDGKSLDSQREEFPKGKRKARKRRRLALQGRGIKDMRKTRKADMLTDDDAGPFSDSSEESMFSEDEIQGGGACPLGSEASASLDETGTM